MQQCDRFYEDEVIEGFYVPAMVKKAWGAQLDVFSEVDAICRRHDIPYFADWGSLLGVLRHAGYVPWDDDLDICMKRKDYERFLEFAKDELPSGFKVMNFKNHPGHLFFVARIVGKDRICFEEDHLRRFRGFPYMAGLDLFVMDYVSRDRNKEDLKSKIAQFVITVADEIADGKADKETVREYKEQVKKYTGVEVDESLSGENLRIYLYSVAERIFAMIPEEEADCLVQMMPYGMYGNKRYLPKEYFEKTVRLPFMNTQICVSACYDAVMRFKFGNYMEIHRKWDGHDYPFFKGQQEEFVKCLDFEYPAYKADAQTIKKSYRKAAEIKGEYTVVMLPFSARYWNYLKPLYELYKRDENADVYVVALPYYYKAWDGALERMQYDIGDYPNEIDVIDYRNFDIKALHPDKIVIQNPFDEWNCETSVPKEYYSGYLRQYTNELIYIPFFKTYDFSPNQGPDYVCMDYYVSMPGVVNADKIILWSDTIKQTYIQKLTDFTKCNADDEAQQIINNKIVVAHELVYDKRTERKCVNLPYFKCDGGKKVLVCFVTLSMLCENGEKAISKIKSILDTFKEKSSGFNVLWIGQLCDGEHLKLIPDEIAREYMEIVDGFADSDFIAYTDSVNTEDYDAIAELGTAYYGNPSAIALKFFYRNKPLMIMDINVM